MNITPIRLNNINNYYKNSINNKVRQTNNYNRNQSDLSLLSLNGSNVYFNGNDGSKEISGQTASLQAKKNSLIADDILKKANTMAKGVSDNYDLAIKELNDYLDSFERKLGKYTSKNFTDDDGMFCHINKSIKDKQPKTVIKKFDEDGNLILEVRAEYNGYFNSRTNLHIEEFVDGKMNTLDYDYKKDKFIIKRGISQNMQGQTNTKAIYEIADGKLSSYTKNYCIFKYNLAGEDSEYETCDTEYHFNQGRLQSYNKKRSTLTPVYKIDDLPSYERTKIEKRMIFKNDKLNTSIDKFSLNMNEIIENHQTNKIYTTYADLLFKYEKENEGKLLQKYSAKNGIQAHKYQVGFSF